MHNRAVLSKSLRIRRKEWGLTQAELATLLGCKSREHVSRIENGKGTPSIELAIACEVVFEHSLRELFPHLYRKIEKQVEGKLRMLHSAAHPKYCVRAIRKKTIINRAIIRIKK